LTIGLTRAKVGPRLLTQRCRCNDTAGRPSRSIYAPGSTLTVVPYHYYYSGMIITSIFFIIIDQARRKYASMDGRVSAQAE
jgi:hypothetical protein